MLGRYLRGNEEQRVKAGPDLSVTRPPTEYVCCQLHDIVHERTSTTVERLFLFTRMAVRPRLLLITYYPWTATQRARPKGP
jgi:hypothetical protein